MTQQQAALIVGGSSGIGEAAAAAFLGAGHLVTIASRSSDKLEAARRRLGDVTALEVDATSDVSVRTMIAQVGRIDHLVIAAGAGVASGPFAELGPDALMAAVNGKLLAQARVVHAAMGRIAPGGSITFIGGVAGRKALPGMAPAAVANLGIEALARALAREIAPIRVNVVAPGLVDTPAYAGMLEASRTAMFAGAAASLPAGRIGAPADIGDAILAIATNRFLTGEVVVIDGGASL